MKNNIFKQGIEILKSNMILGISSALLLTSCVIQPGAYSETDGVYYDPNRDTLPEGVAMNQGNRVGQYYDYQNNNYPSTDQNDIVYDRYKDWTPTNNTSTNDSYGSDWGYYSGSETNYTDWGWNNWWGYPYYGYGWGNPYSFYGWGYPYYGWGYPRWSIGFGFGWGYGGWYDPWSWYGSPYGYYGYYRPSWNYYRNSHSYNTYNAPGFLTTRSGALGNGFRGSNDGGRTSNNGFRDNNGGRMSNNNGNGGFRGNQNANIPRGNQNSADNSGFRPRMTPQQPRNNNSYESSPRFNAPRPEPRYDNGGGFRSGGFGGERSGGFGGGGMRSEGSSGGGFRSGGGGGFRR